VGRAQAAAVADVLAALPPYAILSSDLARARDTAHELARACGLPVQLDPRLRELDLGAWQGLTSRQAREGFPDEYDAWRAGVDVPRGGGETYAQAGKRAAAALQAVPLQDRTTLVAVTHGGTARAALATLLELPDELSWRLAPLGNACWSVLVEADRGWRLERHNTGLGSPLGAPEGAHDVGDRTAERTL